MNNLIFVGFLISVAFVGWPVIGNYSGVSGGMFGSIVAIGTAVAVVLFSAKDMAVGSLPSFKAIGILSVAGFLNGVAVYYYSIKAADNSVQTSSFVATVSIGMVILAPVMYYFTKNITPTWRQGAGYVLAIVAVWLLTPQKTI